MHFVRRGSGSPLLLVHGLGGSWRSWDTVSAALSRTRDLIMVDLPGHGGTPAEADSGTFKGLANSLEAFLEAEGLKGIDAVGSSMGARLVLEMARRGAVSSAVALDPGGFWQGWERLFFRITIGASVKLLRLLRPLLPALCRSKAMRTLLLVQFSQHPWRLDPRIVTTELLGFAATPTFDSLVADLASGPAQQGPAALDSRPVVICWGRQDHLCFPRQAARAVAAFPSAQMHWLESCGHFPHWDQPDETVRLILAATGQARSAQ